MHRPCAVMIFVATCAALEAQPTLTADQESAVAPLRDAPTKALAEWTKTQRDTDSSLKKIADPCDARFNPLLDRAVAAMNKYFAAQIVYTQARAEFGSDQLESAKTFSATLDSLQRLAYTSAQTDALGVLRPRLLKSPPPLAAALKTLVDFFQSNLSQSPVNTSTPRRQIIVGAPPPQTPPAIAEDWTAWNAYYRAHRDRASTCVLAKRGPPSGLIKSQPKKSAPPPDPGPPAGTVGAPK
jgi:hypothetical protein